MSMTLEELTEHADNLAGLLATKRHQLAYLHPDAARVQETVISALEPRVLELREQCARLAAQRTAPVNPLPGIRTPALDAVI